ncbi:hypothetical protein H5410_042245 [Solanum commersonii]|uniref:Retroviral polymerase SH3-like domain-containing protein n=1 Tax=Solanum commersonii TaxID=4109 RepID=A0A9J5XTT1_SOLCO|nr:hypothetical protein H5410_042245 [Solanum commersonii]
MLMKRTGFNPLNRLKKPFSPYSYDPNVVCDHCKRKGHTKTICFRLVGNPPDFEKRRRENQINNQSDKGNYHSERSGGNFHAERGGGNFSAERSGGKFHTAHNVVNNPVRYPDHAPNYTGNVDYSKGMEVIHEQYNQILNMLGKSNCRGHQIWLLATLAVLTPFRVPPQLTHQTKGYVLYDLKNKYFFISRDVIFKESTWKLFPTTVSSPDDVPALLLPSLVLHQFLWCQLTLQNHLFRENPKELLLPLYG